MTKSVYSELCEVILNQPFNRREKNVAKKTSQNIPKNETKHARYYRVCKPRVQKAIKSMRLIKLCASSNYESDKKDLSSILTALEKEVKAIKDAYEKPATTENIDFNF